MLSTIDLIEQFIAYARVINEILYKHIHLKLFKLYVQEEFLLKKKEVRHTILKIEHANLIQIISFELANISVHQLQLKLQYQQLRSQR